MDFLELSFILCCLYLAATYFRARFMPRSRHGSDSRTNSFRRAHSGLFSDKGDRQQRKRRVKRRTLNL